MKLYGYPSKGHDELQQLREVSVMANSNELLALAAFFAKCAFEMQNEKNWDHAHFHDFKGKTSLRSVDIVVASPPRNKKSQGAKVK